jgi:hypothetical protein
MDGFGLYGDMPEPPFVLVSKAFGPFGSVLSIPWNVASGLLRWMWELFWYILESDGAREGYTVVTKVMTTVMAQAATETGWGSMDADEVL